MRRALQASKRPKLEQLNELLNSEGPGGQLNLFESAPFTQAKSSTSAVSDFAALPDEVQNLHDLELLNLEANQIQEIPA